MTVHELLVEGRNVVARGWCQHVLAQDGAHCAVGGLLRPLVADATLRPGEAHLRFDDCCRVEEAVAVLVEHIPAEQLPDVSPALLAPTFPSWSRVAKWNNAPERTQADVLAAFDRAIVATAPPPADPHPDLTIADAVVANA